MSAALDDRDLRLLRRSIELARHAAEHGDDPFGAVLADMQGHCIEGRNRIHSGGDLTAHAELEAIRALGAERDWARRATLYCSTEPCAMCCGAAHWAGVGRIVFSVSAAVFGEVIGSQRGLMPCSELLARLGNRIPVIGPALEAEGLGAHAGYWSP